MKKLSKDKRDKLMLTIIMGLASLVAVYFLLIGTLRQKLEELDKQISTETATKQKAEKVVTLAEKYQKDVEDSERQLQIEQTTMAPQDNRYFWFVNLIRQCRDKHAPETNTTLRTQGSLSRIDVTQTSPETVIDLPAIPKFPYKASLFKIGGTALYDGLGDFLADFENSNPHTRVQNLEISPANQAGAQGAEQMKLAFTMDVVVLIQPK